MKQNNLTKVTVSKLITSLVFIIILLSLMQINVFAANPGTVLTVDTSMNAPSSLTETEDATANDSSESEWVWHPISIVNEPVNGFNTIRRIYSLPADVNPAVISTIDFEMFGQLFEFAYMLQQPTTIESYMVIRETVTFETRSRNLTDILPHLEQQILVERNGYTGNLVLDIHSISTEVAGTTSHTSTLTRQRSFANLSTPDSSYIPRTMSEGNTTFHLYSVDWQSHSNYAIDGHMVASSFTAHATYTTQVTQTRTTGYRVTAEYEGTIYKTTQGETLFMAIFYGDAVVEEQPVEPEPTPNVVIPIEPEQPLPEPDPEPIPDNEKPPEYSNITERYNGNSAPLLSILGLLFGLGLLGVIGFFAYKHFTSYNVSIFSINGPREIVKAGKIKLDVRSHEPTIVLDKIVDRVPAETNRYIIQITQKAVKELVNKSVRVILDDKEALFEIPEQALEMHMYEFEVNFSDDDHDEVDQFMFGTNDSNANDD